MKPAATGSDYEEQLMIFILGGNGFVGSAFKRYCLQANLDFTVISRENYDTYTGQSCDLLINANGNSKKFLAKNDPMIDFDASVRSVRSSLEDFKAGQVVFISSCDVYPDCSSPATSSEDLIPKPELQSPYGFHKYLAEMCVRHSPKPWLIFRLGGVVGPGLRKNPVYDILNGGPLWLDPHSELQYLHVDDAARITFEILGTKLRSEVFNLCGQGLISLDEIVEKSGHPVSVTPNSPRVRYHVSIEKLSALVDIPNTRQTVFEFIEQEKQNP